VGFIGSTRHQVLLLLVEYRASMKSFQALRSPAIPLTSFHYLPVPLIPSSIVLRHVLFDLHLLLYLWGFQYNAMYVCIYRYVGIYLCMYCVFRIYTHAHTHTHTHQHHSRFIKTKPKLKFWIKAPKNYQAYIMQDNTGYSYAWKRGLFICHTKHYIL
jgi:hypothetical protein